MSRARALAQGYQPAVVKVVSYAHGAARASATANYVDREDAVLETQDGLELKGREAINGEIAAWAKDFEPRKESQDVSAVRFHVFGLKDNPADRATLEKAVATAFEGHRYAYRIDALADGVIEARAVVAFAGTLGEGETAARERFYVTERRVGAEEGFSRRAFAPKTEARMKARVEEATGIGQHRLEHRARRARQWASERRRSADATPGTWRGDFGQGHDLGQSQRRPSRVARLAA